MVLAKHLGIDVVVGGPHPSGAHPSVSSKLLSRLNLCVCVVCKLAIELAQAEIFVLHLEVYAFVWTVFACSVINMNVGSTIYDMAAQQHTAAYDRLYAVKEHDLAAYEEIVQQYKEAQIQAQGQALFNQQKLTRYTPKVGSIHFYCKARLRVPLKSFQVELAKQNYD